MIDSFVENKNRTSLPEDIQVAIDHDLDNPTDNTMLFRYGNAVASVGCGFTTERGRVRPWATVYTVNKVENPDEETIELLSILKKYFKKNGYDFAYSFGETSNIRGVLKDLQIKVRETGYSGVHYLGGKSWYNN